ncbi:MAG: CDP-2,3-bis-(O-geranylgeranyl)-sn-glycerol synthase [Candidatus Lokiarchaeota archaeon]|nr:CDP-2,3-bis-(O-geranylgeranyl)-sn-glycerol synthase [Candidatus Lokiarchaeota archaeon]
MQTLLDFLWIIPIGFFYILPAYFANGGAVLMGKYIKGRPIDLGKNFFDDQRILGDGKTWQGLLGGTLIGTFGGFVMWLIVLGAVAAAKFEYNFGFADPICHPILYDMTILRGFLLAFGALMGDMIGSFIKRRFKRERGAKFPILDQLDFILGAVLFSLIEFWVINFLIVWPILLFVIIVTPVLHVVANRSAFKLGLKNEPW